MSVICLDISWLLCHSFLQITIQDVELKDFVDTAIHIDKSDATAIVDTRIQADLNLDGPNAIIVDSGKRVYIGETTIEAPGHAIVAETTTGKILPLLWEHYIEKIWGWNMRPLKKMWN